MLELIPTETEALVNSLRHVEFDGPEYRQIRYRLAENAAKESPWRNFLLQQGILGQIEWLKGNSVIETVIENAGLDHYYMLFFENKNALRLGRLVHKIKTLLRMK